MPQQQEAANAIKELKPRRRSAADPSRSTKARPKTDRPRKGGGGGGGGGGGPPAPLVSGHAAD